MGTESHINRRTMIATLGMSAIGLAMTGSPLSADQASGHALRKLLPKFTDKSHTLLRRLLEGSAYSGQISAADAMAIAQNENLSSEKLMVALLPLAQSYARAPISNFFVGVVVRGANGSLYTGANIEIPGQCLGFAVHAEQSALSNAYMHSEKSVTALAVGGAPCGHCRQFIDEMSPDGNMLILIPDKPPAKLSTLLPAAFGPDALGMQHGAFPVPYTNLSPGGYSGGPEVLAALEAARQSYAPYSKSPSGVAIRTSRRIYRGSYIESVAFNPSLSPLQTALAALIAAGEDYSSISAVALVEAQGAKISQRPVTEIVLNTIAPSAKLLFSVAPY
ncbi:MAG TPA: cytidine deaminase [Candidatus Sulfotelmatobacter sp.]|jgi:cytidine deaminase|nr:cytidine deaminase [Candidatus Sulfotelmatobacter sp.]